MEIPQKLSREDFTGFLSSTRNRNTRAVPGRRVVEASAEVYSWSVGEAGELLYVARDKIAAAPTTSGTVGRRDVCRDEQRLHCERSSTAAPYTPCLRQTAAAVINVNLRPIFFSK